MTSLWRNLSTINMATLPLKASLKEQHSVIHFLWAKIRFPNTIHSEMHAVYGDKCFTRPVMHHVSCKKFACGREIVSTTDAAIAAVTSLTRSHRHASISVQINLDSMLKNKRLMFDI